jgi:hypothetical protein
MLTVAVKYMLRRDIVFFHTILDALERTLMEISCLVEGRPPMHRSGSAIKFTSTRHEQIALIRDFAVQMLALTPHMAELGSYVPNNPMRVIEQLLALSRDDGVANNNSI